MNPSTLILRKKASNIMPCNLFFCKCIEYLHFENKNDITFYNNCYRTNIKIDHKTTPWEFKVIRNNLIKEQLKQNHI